MPETDRPEIEVLSGDEPSDQAIAALARVLLAEVADLTKPDGDRHDVARAFNPVAQRSLASEHQPRNL